ncbi:myotubularin-related protein 5-like isoform X3 [Ciona intestinalis]
MDRLVDYFAVVGYDFDCEETKVHALRGKVITRIPEYEWEDMPFTQGIELFCQPAGWYLTHERQAPTFFVSVLTDAEGMRHYCAVHSFTEPIVSKEQENQNTNLTRRKSLSPVSAGAKKDENEGDTGGDGTPGDEYVDEAMCRVDTGEGNDNDLDARNNKTKPTFAPKCLVILSRINDFRVLKNCLGLIYTVYIEGLTISMENIIAKLLVVKVPPPGSSMLRFSIGAADKQALQTPQSDHLPVTRASVAMLLRQLGILNVLNILCAALVDQKLLFYSCSYSRLSEACNALTALMYPFVYSYPYVPILPKHIVEYTSSPTPFLIGVHSSLKNELHDLLDVITVDLDGGVISIPECVNIPMIPEPYYTNVVEALTKVLCPDLVVADYAYPPEQVKSSEPERLDKEIRAIFLRLFSQLLMGYRSCLQVCRVHPKPIIRFLKENFLLMRGFSVHNTPSANEFVPKLLESQAFSLFVQTNGPPYRKLHKFDELVADVPNRIQSDMNNVYHAMRHIKILASDLYINENPNHLSITEKIPKPSSGSHERLNQKRFPKLSATAVQTFMEENRVRVESARGPKRIAQSSRKVPEGSRPISFAHRSGTTSSRRLEVLKNCMSFIFESKTLEIKKIFQAVLRALKSRSARNALTHELTAYSKTHPQLDNQQFDYIARLINNALQDSSGQLDENTLAADLLPVVTAFYRKLCPTVMQFMYTVVQDHPVWTSHAFWESAFFDDIQDAIGNLYAVNTKKERTTRRLSPTGSQKNLETSNSNEVFGRRDNQMCMSIAAIQLKKWESKSAEDKSEESSSEEGVVFSQAMHNAQRMVFMLVPLDSTRANRTKFLRLTHGEESSSNSYFTNSIAGSMTGSCDEESGFDESDGSSDIASTVSKFVTRFVDHVCTEANISNEHTKMLTNKIPTLVHMQVESLQDVCKESKRLPPIKKAKLLQPNLLLGETHAIDKPLRAYLAADGRATAVGGEIGGPTLLPAEGALFVTTYRVIFIGVPCDALAAEQVVIRSFPVASLFKMKPFNVSEFPHVANIDQNLQHGIQLRSSTFQFLLLSFDEEVSAEQQHQLQNELQTLRYPLTIDGAFAMSAARNSRLHFNKASNAVMRKKAGSTSSVSSTMSSSNRISGTKTLFKQAKRKAGLNKTNRFSRLVMTDSKTKTLYYPASNGGGQQGSNATLGRLPPIDEAMTKTLSDKDTMNRLIQRSCEGDYQRLGLLNRDGNRYRLSRVNRMFSVCRSYPACSVVPMNMSDDQIKSLAHCHHQSRFPSIVWLHPTTKAVLMRSSGIRTRTASSLFKHGQSAPMSVSDEGTAGSGTEEEKFLMKIASYSTPMSRPSSELFRPDSLNSLSSTGTDDETHLRTPQSTARGHGGALTSSLRKPRKWGTLTRSNGKPVGERTSPSPMLNSRSPSPLATNGGSNGTIAQSAMYHAMSKQAKVYVFGEKAQLKNLKHEQQGKVMFVPLDITEPKQIRISFKSMIKSCLPPEPPPSTNLSTQPQQVQDTGFRKDVEDSGWLVQVSQLLEVAGAVVDVIDIHGGSVMIAVEDGCDTVPQISSLAQVMLDPHYRTIEGFQTLIQKEWLSFGHRFSHRNRFNDVQSSGFTPVFLQFLDAVYQLINQFPISFEFNTTYLELIAYHSMSNRFTTFLLDSDYERLEAGILFEKKVNSRSPGKNSLASSSSTSPPVSPSYNTLRPYKSLWEYIDAAHSKSHLFLNTFYSPQHLSSQVLRPIHSMCRLKLWPYYIREALGEGPPFDGSLGELTSGTSHNEQEATETSEVWGGVTGRRVVNGCYDNIADAQPDTIKMLLSQIDRLQTELGVPVDSWNSTWKAINTSTPKRKNVPEYTKQARSEVRALHKLTTVNVIHKAMDFLHTQQLLPQRMRSMSVAITSFTASSPYIRRSAIREESVSSENWANPPEILINSVNDTMDTASLYDQFQTSSKPEVRTYEGSLWKQGAYMKGWKPRFFVLDTTKHELRQYENKGDNICKSIIDLKELESVQLMEQPLSGGPKGASGKALFEVKLSKRQYHFIAENEQAARDWVDNLQSAL